MDLTTGPPHADGDAPTPHALGDAPPATSTAAVDRDRPASGSERLDALDLVRGVALLGILLMNIRAFAMITAAYSNPTFWGGASLSNTVVYYATSILADQRFMTLFSLLFGAGVALMTSRAERAGARAVPRHFRRMAWLLVFGLIHAYLIWWGDVLTAYAIAGAVVVYARRRSVAGLYRLGAILLLIPVLFSVALDAAIPEMSFEELAEIKEITTPNPEKIAEETHAYLGTYSENLRYRVPEVFEFQTHILILYIGRIMGLMVLGMALLRDGVLTGNRSAAFYRNLAIGGFLVGSTMTGYGAHALVERGFDARYAMGLGGLWNYFGSLFGAAGWLGLVLFLRARGVWPGLRARFAAVGRMAFTHYIFHSVVCTTLFYGFGFGLFGTLSSIAQLAVVCAIWAVQLAISPWWLARYRFGPLEWCWRALTYGERPAMRR